MLEGWEKRPHGNETCFEMNKAVEDTECTYEIYKLLVLKKIGQRSSLNRGMLKEKILEPALLKQIVEHMAKARHPSVSGLPWLYRCS